MRVSCWECGRILPSIPPYHEESKDWGKYELCGKCEAIAGKRRGRAIKRGICPYCDGPLEDAPVDNYCSPCRWYFDNSDEDPGPTLPMEDIDADLLPGDGIMTPYGPMTSGFNRDKPPWQR